MFVFQPRLLIAVAISMLSFGISAAAPKTAIADDGREVILHDDGSWSYATEDRFATTPSGQRILLKPDSTWRKARDSEAPAYQPVPLSTLTRDSAVIKNSNINLILDDVFIEHQREDRGKNTKLRSNLVFHVEATGENQPGALPDAEDFTVTDSRGRHYPTFSVKSLSTPNPNEQRLEIRANGAPRWWGVKFLELEVQPDTFGNPATIELRKSMADVIRKEVSELPDVD